MNLTRKLQGFGALAVVLALFAVSLVVGFRRIDHLEDRITGEVTVAMWLMGQTEAEYLKFVNHLDKYYHGDPAVTLDDVTERFEILWSRLPLVLDSPRATAIREIEDLEGTIRGLLRVLEKLEPLVFELRRGDNAAYVAIHAQLDPVARPLHQLMVDTYLQSAWRTAFREDRSAAARLEIAIALMGTLLSGGALIYLMLREMRRAKRLLASTVEAQEALGEAHSTLEQRVEERTTELERKGVDLVRLAGDLTIARDEARAADRAKSKFLAAMSHELRTPLNAIIGFSEIIKDETFGPVGSVQYRDYASDIHESGHHLLKLINDILDLSKIESGKDKLHEDKIEISEILRSALKLVGYRAAQGGIRLELGLQDPLPALRADERKLKQILVNLLSNAVKFTDAGGVVTLRARCRMGSGHVFQIVDTGIGIAPEDLPKALARFGQVDADLNRQYEGTGLGLPLTKALVEQHGGVLDLQSEVSVGTTVTVRFPAERIVGLPRDNMGVCAADKKAG